MCFIVSDVLSSVKNVRWYSIFTGRSSCIKQGSGIFLGIKESCHSYQILLFTLKMLSLVWYLMLIRQLWKGVFPTRWNWRNAQLNKLHGFFYFWFSHSFYGKIHLKLENSVMIFIVSNWFLSTEIFFDHNFSTCYGTLMKNSLWNTQTTFHRLSCVSPFKVIILSLYNDKVWRCVVW